MKASIAGVGAGASAGLVANHYGFGLELFAATLVLTVVLQLSAKLQRAQRALASELHDLKIYLEDVGTAATAIPGSAAWIGVKPSALQLRRVEQVTCKARGAVESLGALLRQLQQPGLVNLLRRSLLHGPLLWEASVIRARLDAVRVGHHPRWGGVTQHGVGPLPPQIVAREAAANDGGRP